MSRSMDILVTQCSSVCSFIPSMMIIPEPSDGLLGQLVGGLPGLGHLRVQGEKGSQPSKGKVG